jgi:catechol 2,3-dioxygenase-like lactoylglutathione lyase family enzyme
VSVYSLGWLGVRTDRFGQTVALYRDVLGLEPFHADETSVRFRLRDGTELHVYGPADENHRFFGTAPVVGLAVEDAAATRERLEAAGVDFLTELERDGGAAWCHFRGPDGNVYEIISGAGDAP